MIRPGLSLAVALAFASAPVFASPAALTAAEEVATAGSPFQVTREHVTGDIYHYQFDIRVGSTPNAIVRIHRVVRENAPWHPLQTQHAVMLLHGDFANFITNFVPTLGNPASPSPGLAPYLVSQGIDTWGVDRRWTLPGVNGDISDFGAMGVSQELGDVALALAFAEVTRTVTDGDPRPIILGGFSHGGELTYAYAASNGRFISAIAALDIYYDIAPADPDLQAFACSNATFESAQLDAGVTDSPNTFFIQLGDYDRSAPNDPSPVFGPPYTNRQAILLTAGATYELGIAYTPVYHLISPLLDVNGNVTGVRKSPEDSVSAWFAGAPPHQSMHEAADLDGIWCAASPRPELKNIKVPLFYLGAAGAFGDYGLYTTTRVSSTSVTTHVVHLFGPARVAEDFGHGDLLFAVDAPKLAWQPLTEWLLNH
jgi:hypothetical protein